MSLVEEKDAAPPWAYRLLAADGKLPLSWSVICQRSGLSRTKVYHLSQLQSWAGVKMSDADAFARGCGFSLVNQGEVLRRIKRAAQHPDGILSLRHLKARGPFWQRGIRANYLRLVTTKMIQ